jgi:microcystin-dependent protein
VLSSGISIQGIARDENNSALANMSSLPLVFKIYYLNSSNAEVDIKNESSNVITDNFGVFSYVMTIDKTLFTTICNTQAYLKVSSGSTVFSNEKLQAVPYAIHAQNGVPTGTIMAFVGETAPEGWLLCNGASFADNPTNAKLRELLGSFNTPDLKARYLRGTGTVSGREAIGLRGTQDDATKPHNHAAGSLTTSTAGNHNHNDGDWSRLLRNNTFLTVNSSDTSSAEPNLTEAKVMLDAGNHTHTISGNTADSGNTTANETRVFSYGVNYIIKI